MHTKSSIDRPFGAIIQFSELICLNENNDSIRIVQTF